MDYEIRHATEDDIPQLLAFAERLFTEHPPGTFARETPTLEDEAKFVRSRLKPENSTILVAVVGPEVIGVIDLNGGSLIGNRHCGMFGLSVDRDYRGQGLGTELIEALLEWAPTVGITRVEGGVFSNNPDAQRLYERMGFLLEGRQVGAVMEGDEEFDIIMLAKRLPAR